MEDMNPIHSGEDICSHLLSRVRSGRVPSSYVHGPGSVNDATCIFAWRGRHGARAFPPELSVESSGTFLEHILHAWLAGLLGDSMSYLLFFKKFLFC